MCYKTTRRILVVPKERSANKVLKFIVILRHSSDEKKEDHPPWTALLCAFIQSPINILLLPRVALYCSQFIEQALPTTTRTKVPNNQIEGNIISVENCPTRSPLLEGIKQWRAFGKTQEESSWFALSSYVYVRKENTAWSMKIRHPVAILSSYVYEMLWSHKLVNPLACPTCEHEPWQGQITTLLFSQFQRKIVAQTTNFHIHSIMQ